MSFFLSRGLVKKLCFGMGIAGTTAVVASVFRSTEKTPIMNDENGCTMTSVTVDENSSSCNVTPVHLSLYSRIRSMVVPSKTASDQGYHGEKFLLTPAILLSAPV